MSDLQIEKNSSCFRYLEQIEHLNHMIDFHKNKSGEESMMRQYGDMRNEFLKELETCSPALRLTFRLKI